MPRNVISQKAAQGRIGPYKDGKAMGGTESCLWRAKNSFEEKTNQDCHKTEMLG